MATTPHFDLVLANAHVVDATLGIDGPGQVAVRDGRIAAVAPRLPEHTARQTIDVGGAVVCAGLVDLHTHVYEWVTNFGVKADDAGIDSGVTTIVDAGSAGAWTFGGFKAYVIERSQTDVRSFTSINVAGALKGGMRGDILHNPGMVDVDDLVKVARAHPHDIRGFKCHGESGALSHWGTAVLELAVEAGNRADLPLYCHTGELFPVVESSRPVAEQVLEQVVPVLRPGDTLAHVYSAMPDGIMGKRDKVPPIVFAALERGLHFDIGYGINFSYAIARTMMAAGVLPNTISSDVHGDFGSYHDLRKLDYSLCGAMTRLVALGMPLMEVIRRTTVNPAKVLRAELEIGTLEPHTRADITVLDRLEGAWPLKDGQGETLVARERLMPRLVLRDGVPHVPHNRLLTDLTGRMLPLAA
jgi:dihydroorotase